MEDMIAIVGTGETPPVRKGSKDVKTLVTEAVLQALDDAGIAPQEVDGIVTETGLMPQCVSHDYMAEQLGISRCFDANISYGGAGNVCTPLLAQMAIKAGLAKVVISYFGFCWASYAGGPYAFHDVYPAKAIFEGPYGFHGQAVYFSLLAQRYRHEYGLTSDQLASLAIIQREHALLNGRGVMTKPLTLEDYYQSRMVSDPLRVPDCCVIADGACAFVMTSAERAKDCPHPPVYVMGVGFGSSPISCDSFFTQNPAILEMGGAAQASAQAQKMAGISIEDVDFAQIYDCFTISCLLQIEDVGFCKKGEGGAFIEEGNTKLKGKIPINTHGGLLSYSYNVGMEHVIEAVSQLRHAAGPAQVEGAEIGLVGGLAIPDYGVLILKS